MHPAALLFVLIFLPNTTLRDWSTANAPNLQKLMQTGALGLMNARTAETDKITTNAGERTVLAGARMFPAQRSPLSSTTQADNLEDTLAASDVALVGDVPLPFIEFSSMVPPPSRELIVENLDGSLPDIDQQIGRYADLVDRNNGVLMVVSPNPTVSEYNNLHQLTPVLLWSPGMPSSLLVSPSTRTRGLITNTDIAPTIAKIMGTTLVLPSYGAAVTVLPASSDKVADLLKSEDGWIAQASTLHLLPYLAAIIAILVIALVLVPNNPASAKSAAVVMTVPLALLLSSNLLIAAALFVVFAVAAYLILKPSDVLIFGALTVTIMVMVDAFVFAGHLTGASLLGYSPIEGARYYGIGNEVMGALFGALVVITGIWDAPGRDRRILIGLWLVAGFALALPFAGAKAGGLIVCATILAVYLSISLGKNIDSSFTVFSVIGACIVSLAVLITLSHVGPQTHVTQAVSMTKAGGFSIILKIILRKASMDLHLVFHSVWMLVLLATSYGRWKLKSTTMLSVIGTAATISCLVFNDAGVVAAALCGLNVWAAEFLLCARSSSTGCSAARSTANAS